MAAQPRRDGFGAAAQAVLAEHAIDVRPHRAVRETEPRCDLLVGEAGSDQCQHL